MKNDPRSCDRNFYNCVMKPEKNSGLQRGLNPWEESVIHADEPQVESDKLTGKFICKSNNHL